jgi:hypothetical protein
MTPSAVLLAAADLLERDGWCQHNYMNDQGHRCVSQAIYDVYRMDWMAAASLVVHCVSASLPEWNDAPGQNAGNVIATLRRAAQ